MKTSNWLGLYLLLGSIILYYLVPSIASYALSSKSGFAFSFMILIFINPAYCIISGYYYTKHNGFKWYFSVFIGLAFVPAVYFIYNSSAAVYAIIYTIFAYIGSFIGMLLLKKYD